MPDLTLHVDHPWDLSPAEAVALQTRLARLVEEVPLPQPPKTVAAVDVSYRGGVARGAAVIMNVPALEVLQAATVEADTPFPYVPGLLAFREIPVILKVLERLPFLPDVILCDGHGKAHPRRFGLACHLGVLLDRPTVGCAKRVLVGTHAPLPQARGAWAPIVDRGETIGIAVRTRRGVRPVYVSVGHRITLAEAAALVLRTSTRYRLPEPLRVAHRLSASPK